jgi:beta-lactam-binding protein with PASTA domain
MKYLLKNLTISIVLFLVVLIAAIYFVLGYLNNYTMHGESVSVPDIKGMLYDEAVVKLEEGEFRYELVDSIFDRTKKPGEVIIQIPSPNSQVKVGRKIYITINARSKKTIKLFLDNILSGSSTVRGAMDNLGSYDVIVDSIVYVDYQYNDIVLGILDYKGKSLKSEDVVFAGSRLILKVGKKGYKSVLVPDLQNFSVDDAKKELMLLQLNYSISELENSGCGSNPDSSSFKVKQQTPISGIEVKTGTVIQLLYDCE